MSLITIGNTENNNERIVCLCGEEPWLAQTSDGKIGLACHKCNTEVFGSFSVEQLKVAWQNELKRKCVVESEMTKAAVRAYFEDPSYEELRQENKRLRNGWLSETCLRANAIRDADVKARTCDICQHSKRGDDYCEPVQSIVGVR